MFLKNHGFNIDLLHEHYCCNCHRIRDKSKFNQPHNFFKQADKCDGCFNKNLTQLTQKRLNKINTKG